MNEPYPQETALAALAAEVEALRRAVDGLAAVPGQVADLAGLVAALGESTAAAAPDGGAGVPSWLDLAGDFADTVAVLGELVAWMRTVYLRYTDAAAGLPECWLWHPDVVEELLWLRAAWIEAYGGESPSVARVGDWHDRQRPGVVRRIRGVAGTCSLEAHQPGGERHRGAEPVPLAEAIHGIGEWWATDRDAMPPAPDATHIAAAAGLRAPRRTAMTPPTDAGEDAYEAGLRAGYGHGYDVGVAHGRTQVEDDLDLELEGKALRAFRFGGPTRDELTARGRIPIDHTRPPALPVRLWDASDWAKADHRDLPTTEHGHAHWRDALAAGRVPQHLADAYAAEHPQRAASTCHFPARSATELAERVTRDVAESDRAVTAARTRLDRIEPKAIAHESLAPLRVANTAILESAHGDWGLGR